MDTGRLVGHWEWTLFIISSVRSRNGNHRTVYYSKHRLYRL